MSFLFKIILVVIFAYLIYEIFFKKNISNDPYSRPQDKQDTPDVKSDASVQKKIDMSDVEDADYKEIK
ncbi:MAG: hypothetical protein DRP93_08495 [Candidatus Neomarinimicrobiota bacterium]|nr:MAG: hypothetical protein DRP93_08495 [Candidatus Neomarinimicrobiota bacterium]